MNTEMETEITNPPITNQGSDVIQNSSTALKDFHKPSWSGLFFILKKRGTLTKWPLLLSVAVSFLLSIFLYIFSENKMYDIIVKTSDLLVTVFPGLLGFSLGGYAIVVGFSNTQLIKESSRVDRASIYQLLNSIFSLSLLIQVFTIIFSFLIDWLIKSDIANAIIHTNVATNSVINAVCIFLLLFGSLYSLALTPYIIINLFTLSQINNLFFTKEKIKEKKV